MRKAANHRYIGQIHRPDPVWPFDRQLAQQAWIDRVLRSVILLGRASKRWDSSARARSPLMA